MDPLAAVLLGFISTAFLAWAGVVWKAWADIRRHLFEVTAALAKLEVHIEDLRADKQSALRDLASLVERVRALEMKLSKLRDPGS